jgi:hypothetical protein
MTLADLRQALTNLRARWPQDWPGLDRVVASCWRMLDADEGSPCERRIERLRRCSLDLAARLERHGLRCAAQQREPAYHNRLHNADVVVAVTALLLVQRRLDGRTGTRPNRAEACLLLAAVAHDGWHAGRINRRPFEQESRSLRRTLGCLARHELPAAERRRIARLVLATEPEMVRHRHRSVRRRRFDLDSERWQSVLLQEADILASALPDPGTALTAALADEWRQTAPAAAESLRSPDARRRFLLRAALFSSPASLALGLDHVVKEGITALTPAA